MTLPDEYEQQDRWRRFDEALTHVPLRPGERVLDLGCGVGAVTSQLARGGAEVIGVDVNEELLARARALHPGVRFEHHDIGALSPSTFGRVDGVWSSFVAAYFADLDAFVARLRDVLTDGGWLALVEIDDLLGHEPRSAALASEIAAFHAWARESGGYGFLHGRALAPAMRDAGFEILFQGSLPDVELALDGPASADVLAAWGQRFARMGGMQGYFGERFAAVSGGVLEALRAPSHRSFCRVELVVGRR